MKTYTGETVLKTYTGETVLPEGVLNVKVKYQEECHDLKLYVVKGVGPPLFGRQWLDYIKLDWKNIITIITQNQHLKYTQFKLKINCLFLCQNIRMYLVMS